MADEATRTKPQGGTPKGKAKPRSPSYPGVDLQIAIGLAKEVWDHDGRNEAAEDTILGHWNYKPKSGAGLVALAALKAFGLIESGKTKGRFKLTDLAFSILLDDREDDWERMKAIQSAALNPAMHRAAWEKFGADLPSDATFRYYLLKDKLFTEPGAKQFIEEYKSSLAFSQLIGGDSIISKESDEEVRMQQPGSQSKGSPPTPFLPTGFGSGGNAGNVREIPIPISGAVWPSIKATFPMSEDAWTQMLAVLKAMKPGLVTPRVVGPGEVPAADRENQDDE